ncbi:hypothetical protein MKW92_010676 [Papaver armeniacum]|nr:hypothetical protein MKW92_010676 [Papaver armeniacum]
MARELSVKAVQNGLAGLSLHNGGDNVSYILAVDVSNSTYRTYDVYYHKTRIRTTVTHTASVVDQWIEDVYNDFRSKLKNVVVGLDIEWTRQPRGHNSTRNRVAVLQLCLCRRCLIFQISWCHNIPQSLHDFLSDEKFVFVGVGIDGDAHKLWLDYRMTVARAEELGSLAAYKLTKTVKEYKERHFYQSGLKDLARNVLGEELPKKRAIQLSNWDHCLLTAAQIEYACLDAFVSFQLGIHLRSLLNPVHIEVNLGAETAEPYPTNPSPQFFSDALVDKEKERVVIQYMNPYPSPQFFSDALVDKEKERVVIQYMKSRFRPVINMMLQVNKVNQGLGFNGGEDDLIRQLIKTAARKPFAFNFECRYGPPSD